MSEALIGRVAPPLEIAEWLQDGPLALSELTGNVVLLAVFQVNCPGCFLHCLPKVESLHQSYHKRGLRVLGLATAFEDFDKNTTDNLRKLLQEGRVIGETEKILSRYGLLQNGIWPHSLTFPVAMDKLTPRAGGNLEAEINRLHGFAAPSELEREILRNRLRAYWAHRPYRPETFDRYGLQGTPSYVLIARGGMVHASRFGAYEELESDLTGLL
ncbi:thioredoxin domain-containing protein [Methylomonas rhizoryzae]|uniref:redoxin domain-containing protein n=1 Tax=Methylomonas rhizoryzae TaxID=2608981 RepID=UPI001231C4D6|nr:redoxin domain-containing protein [Methylomonas rhizoryzae]